MDGWVWEEGVNIVPEFVLCGHLGTIVTGSVLEVELEVESSEYQVVPQKQTKVMEKRVLFSIDYIPVFHLFDKWIYKKFECNSLF